MSTYIVDVYGSFIYHGDDRSDVRFVKRWAEALPKEIRSQQPYLVEDREAFPDYRLDEHDLAVRELGVKDAKCTLTRLKPGNEWTGDPITGDFAFTNIQVEANTQTEAVRKAKAGVKAAVEDFACETPTLKFF